MLGSRRSFTLMRVSAASERLERDYDIVVPIIEGGELAEVWLEGQIDFAGLSTADRHRLLFFKRRAIILRHHAYQLRKQSLLPDANWAEQTSTGVQRSFSLRRASTTP